MTDIQQTAGDRLRFEVILKSLTEGGINLAILSEHDLVLDFYANLVDERLRARGDAEVEFCFSTNSERLVQKFNEILSSLTVDEALERDQNHVKRRYLVFRDSILMQDFELQLLARLVNGFPASNISVILLINSAGSNRNKLDAFGKSLLQWEVETRAGAPKQSLDDWVTEASVEPLAEPPVVDDVVEAETVQQLLNPPKAPSWRIPGFGAARKAETEVMSQAAMREGVAVPAISSSAGASAVAELPTAPAGEPELWLTRHAASAPPVPEPAPAPIPAPTVASPAEAARPRRLPWGLLLLVPLLSASAFAFMYRDRLEQEVESFRKYLLRGTPAPLAEVPAAPASAASAEMPASEAAPAPLEAPVPAPSAPANVTESAVAPVVAAPPAAAVARETPAMREATPASAVTSTTAAPVTPAVTAKAKEATPRPSKEAAASPQVGGRSDDAWTEQMAPGDYVVQLAAFDTEDEALAFRRSDSVYAKAHILRVRKKESDKRYYVLVVGPLTSKAEAQAFMQSSPLLAKGWLRSAKSLQAQR